MNELNFFKEEKVNFKTVLLVMLTLMPMTLRATIFHAPPNFKSTEGQVVFVDFISGDYKITYDPKTKKVSAVSTIVFESGEEGLPAFDLKTTPTQISLDGEIISSKVISSPEKDTWFRIALKSIKPGSHTLIISSLIEEEVLFLNEGVSSAFWFTDLGDRAFLESYLPANFEYDQYKIILNLDFKTFSKQRIYSNGVVTKLQNNTFSVEFPDTYTSSSLYFHTSPIGRYPEKLFIFRSLDGRDIPVTLYAAAKNTDLESIKNKILSSLNFLESTYGAFLHSTLTVFIAGNGGMEYCGATMTDTWAINHELTHSYFARGGFMPANGNAGWVDEAITSWSDEGAGMRPDMKAYSNMAGNSPYRRYTHSDAYSVGKTFMYYLNHKFQANGGLTAFLNQLIEKDQFKPMTTEEFIKKMSTYYSEDLWPLFKKHMYSEKASGGNHRPARRPVHMKMTIKEMQQYL